MDAEGARLGAAVIGRSVLTRAGIWFLLNLTNVACGSSDARWSVVTPSRIPMEPLSIPIDDHAKDCRIRVRCNRYSSTHPPPIRASSREGSNRNARGSRRPRWSTAADYVSSDHRGRTDRNIQLARLRANATVSYRRADRAPKLTGRVDCVANAGEVGHLTPRMKNGRRILLRLDRILQIDRLPD